MIESVKNPKVKEWLKLKDKKMRDQTNTFLIEGDHLLNEALSKGVVKEIISYDLTYKVEGIPFYEVSLNVLKKLSSQVSGTNVIAIAKKLESREIKGNVCLLDNIQDPGNLGAIIRSACAFGIDTIVMSMDTVDLYNDKVIRASEGMLFKINFIKKDLKEMIAKLKEMEYSIYGTDVNDGVSLKKIKFSKNSAIIIGNEGNGMQEDLKKKCDKLVTIPIKKTCESLNASIAASIIFYELGLK